jgi:cytochrome c biogenesis protein CcmG/thiol:disulfide interchange protein DsbE
LFSARSLKFGILSTLAAGLLAACAPGFAAAPAPEVGAAAPQITLRTLQGQPASLSALRGQVVLVNFWATWCGPCRLEMPAIQARYNDGGFAVLAVNFNEPADQVRAFVDELDLSFPILLDPGGKVQELFRVRGYPTSFFVDATGVIQILHLGELSAETLDAYLVEMGVHP